MEEVSGVGLNNLETNFDVDEPFWCRKTLLKSIPTPDNFMELF